GQSPAASVGGAAGARRVYDDAPMSDMSCDISLAYSVDADDAFMFHAIQTGAVDTDGLTFSHRRADTAELNRLAIAGAADVVAVSVGVYPRIAPAYQIL